MVRLVLRGRPGPDTHEAARELRRRIHRALIENKVPTSLSRDLVIRGWPDVPAGAPPASAMEPIPAPLAEPRREAAVGEATQRHEPVSET